MNLTGYLSHTLEVQPHKNSDIDTGNKSRQNGGHCGNGPSNKGCTFIPQVPFLFSGERKSFFMNAKNIATGGITAGFLLLILMMVSGYLVNIVLPADISHYGGMRAMNDPVMNLFYLSRSWLHLPQQWSLTASGIV
jgi:hypothetical protein